MAYCTYSDLAIQLGYDSFGTTTKPTAIQVASIIDNVTADIDILLQSIGISLPITDSSVLLYLKDKCIMGSCCRIGFSYFSNNTGVDGTQPNHFCSDYSEWKKEIKENPAVLTNILSQSDSAPSSNVLDGTITEDDIKNNMIPLKYDRFGN